MRELAGEQPTQQVGPPRLVVDVADQRVLDRDTPTRARCVVPRRLKHFGDLPSLIDRDKLVAQIIIGRMQRKRKGQRKILAGQPLNRRYQSDR